MSIARIASLAMVVAAIVLPLPAFAQTPAETLPGRVDASIGLSWVGHQKLGTTTANETTGTGGALQIFTAASELASAAGVEARVAVRVLRSVEAALDASYAKPKLNIALASDIENAPAVVATETIQHVMIGGSVAWFPPIRAGRVAPFATAGAGYLRQVHENGTLVDSGHYYQVGGGMNYSFFSHPERGMKAAGVRADLKVVLRAKGVAFDDSLHAAPAIGAAFFVRF